MSPSVLTLEKLGCCSHVDWRLSQQSWSHDRSRVLRVLRSSFRSWCTVLSIALLPTPGVRQACGSPDRHVAISELFRFIAGVRHPQYQGIDSSMATALPDWYVVLFRPYVSTVADLGLRGSANCIMRSSCLLLSPRFSRYRALPDRRREVAGSSATCHC